MLSPSLSMASALLQENTGGYPSPPILALVEGGLCAKDRFGRRPGRIRLGPKDTPMSTATVPQTTITDWRQEWFEFEGATYLNLASQAPLPKVTLKAIQATMDAKKFPYQKPDSIFFEVPNRCRANIAKLIGAQPEEIALTTGASSGAMAVAYALNWKSSDEVLTSRGEFPLQYTTWKPMEQREGIKVNVVAPQGKFLTTDDVIAALTQGALLLLDVSQSCGAVPMDVRKLGADFLVCAGYKWLLGAFGTGFFWIKRELLASVRPGPFYWMAVAGSDNFSKLDFSNPKVEESARRWDAPEWASHFNFNLESLDASVEFVLRATPETVLEHNQELIDFMFSRLPVDRCVAASPLDRKLRGPYGCFVARTPERTAELYKKLREQNVHVSLREGKIRVSPYLFNTIQDIDRLIAVITT